MTLLIFGQTGQVARELARRAPEAVFLDRAQADLTGLDLDHWCTDNYDESFLKAGSVRSLPTSCP